MIILIHKLKKYVISRKQTSKNCTIKKSMANAHLNGTFATLLKSLFPKKEIYLIISNCLKHLDSLSIARSTCSLVCVAISATRTSVS